MRSLIAGLMLLALTASPVAAQTQTVLCGLVRSHNPATATTQGQFALVNSTSWSTVGVAAGQNFAGTGWTCVSATPGPGQSHTFVAVVPPGAAGYQGPSPLVACGTAEPVGGPLSGVAIGLRTSSGLMLFDVPPDQRSPGYQCIRYLRPAGNVDVLLFVSFARPGDPDFIAQTAPVRTLPSTSTAPDRRAPVLGGIASAVLLVLGLRARQRNLLVTQARDSA